MSPDVLPSQIVLLETYLLLGWLLSTATFIKAVIALIRNDREFGVTRLIISFVCGCIFIWTAVSLFFGVFIVLALGGPSGCGDFGCH